MRVALATPLADAAGGARYLEMEGGTVEEVLRELTVRHAALAALLWREGGRLNPMLAIFRNQDDIRTLQGLATPLEAGDELAVISALEGG